ncbi:unnamed protein product, partial [Didymodactylos carnosus]
TSFDIVFKTALFKTFHGYFIEQHRDFPIRPRAAKQILLRGSRCDGPSVMFLVGSNHENSDTTRLFSKQFQAFECDFMFEVGKISIEHLHLIENCKHHTYVRIPYPNNVTMENFNHIVVAKHCPIIEYDGHSKVTSVELIIQSYITG